MGSLEMAIVRLKEQETISEKPSQNLKACVYIFSSQCYEYVESFRYYVLISIEYKYQQNLAKDEYESNFVSAVVAPGEIGVKFNDVGALEEVKKALNELVILPMRRPELFSHGNLLRVLILLFT
jgi:ATP-dependent 26S proteasome regulatory subunit